MSFDKAIKKLLDDIYPFTSNELNSSRTKGYIPSMSVMKSLKFILHSLTPTLMSRSLGIRLRHISIIKTNLKRGRRTTITI